MEGRKEAWRERGLTVGYLPRYSPHLNPMEGVWRRVKGFLMPRRHYGGVEELREAVVQALKALGGVELKILGEGT
ncbi:IS630 family transposase, partial [Thermus scotoductus]